jgi:hypothetical protein
VVLGRQLGTYCAAALAALAFAVSATAASPTHASFVTQADALCTNAGAESAGFAAPTTAKQAAAYLKKLIPIIAQLRKATLALPAPKADRPAIVAGMAHLANELKYLGQAEGAAEAANLKAYGAAMTAAKKENVASSVFAKKLGLKSCA